MKLPSIVNRRHEVDPSIECLCCSIRNRRRRGPRQSRRLSGCGRGRSANQPSPRERLLAACDELFYHDGVHSTGIDAVIEKADVAKGSLYYICGGKDELFAAYLLGRLEKWRQRVQTAQAGIDNPDEKFLAAVNAIADDVSLPEFRGCPFVNAAAESPAGKATYCKAAN
jgi:AcrR family transcriptional regulator